MKSNHHEWTAARFRTAAIATLAGLLWALEADANDQIKMLGQRHACALNNQNLSGRHLAAIDLKEARLEDVSFVDARLAVAVFDLAVLRDVSFASADLSGASFIDARLLNVSFAGAKPVHYPRG